MVRELLALGLVATRWRPYARLPEAPDEFDTKFPWWRITPGELVVETKRVGQSNSIEGLAPAGYGETGFSPSGLVFDGEGCWEVTGRVGDESLAFVVWACPTEEFGPSVSITDREACGAT